MNQAFSKIWIIVIIFVLLGGGYFAWQYFGAPESKEITKRDGIRKLELQQIAVYQETYYSTNDQYYQSMDYPLDVLPWTDPKTGEIYGWIDNTKNGQKFCAYGDLEKGGFYVVSHYGTGEIATEPRTLDDCEKVPNLPQSNSRGRN